jgi:hypothetical protein
MLISALLMGANGAAYILLGVCMLFPVHHPWRQRLGQLYPSLFKEFLVPPLSDEEAQPAEQPPAPLSAVRLCGDLVHQLGYRMLGYLLLVVGLCRTITCFHWGCGYIYLGLGTCLAEIGMLCNELLRQESMLIHRTMAVLLLNVAVSLLYIGGGLPYCTS